MRYQLLRSSIRTTLLITSLAFGSLSCGTESQLCDLECDCEGCSDSEFNHCLDEFDDDFRKADRSDCVDRYDDWLACQDETGRCDGDDWKTSCKSEKDRFKKCAD